MFTGQLSLTYTLTILSTLIRQRGRAGLLG